MSYRHAVSFSIPHQAHSTYTLLQDTTHPIADLKIILTNAHKPNEPPRVILVHSSLLKKHCDYFEHVLSGDFSDLEADPESPESKEYPRKLLRISEECNTKLMVLLIRCLCSRKVKGYCGMYKITLRKTNVEKITFNSLLELVQFIILADKWQIRCFNYSELVEWIETMFSEYNEWWIGRHTNDAKYVHSWKPNIAFEPPFKWQCNMTYLHLHRYVPCKYRNEGTVVCSKCGSSAPSRTPLPIQHRNIANLTPPKSIDLKSYISWKLVLPDSIDVDFFCLVHASRWHPAVCHESLSALRLSKYTRTMADTRIVDHVFRNTFFNIKKGVSVVDSICKRFGSEQVSGFSPIPERNVDISVQVDVLELAHGGWILKTKRRPRKIQQQKGSHTRFAALEKDEQSVWD